MLNGADISHYQNVNWATVSKNSQKLDFILIKATQGATFVDPEALHHANGARAYKIPLTYYHFATISTGDVTIDATTEATFFHNTISKFPSPDFAIALDVENNDAKRSKEDVLKWINSFFAQLSKLGHKKYMLYSYVDFLDRNLPSKHNLGQIPLWVASYRQVAALPIGWTSYQIWQYTDKGKINGIPGNVDLDRTDKPLPPTI